MSTINKKVSAVIDHLTNILTDVYFGKIAHVWLSNHLYKIYPCSIYFYFRCYSYSALQLKCLAYNGGRTVPQR